MERGFTKRNCPRCNGNVFIDRDINIGFENNNQGWYEWCLQCGFRGYLIPSMILTEELKALAMTKETVTA